MAEMRARSSSIALTLGTRLIRKEKDTGTDSNIRQNDSVSSRSRQGTSFEVHF